MTHARITRYQVPFGQDYTSTNTHTVTVPVQDGGSIPNPRAGAKAGYTVTAKEWDYRGALSITVIGSEQGCFEATTKAKAIPIF